MLIYIWGTPDTVCYFGLADSLKWSYGLIDPNFKVIDSIKLLTHINMRIFNVFEIAAISLSSFTCLDLLLSVKNPFTPGYKRMKFYLIGTILIIIIGAPITSSVLKDPNEMFDTYLLPYYYLDEDYKSTFKTKTNEVSTTLGLDQNEISLLGINKDKNDDLTDIFESQWKNITVSDYFDGDIFELSEKSSE